MFDVFDSMGRTNSDEGDVLEEEYVDVEGMRCRQTGTPEEGPGRELADGNRMRRSQGQW